MDESKDVYDDEGSLLQYGLVSSSADLILNGAVMFVPDMKVHATVQ